MSSRGQQVPLACSSAVAQGNQGETEADSLAFELLDEAVNMALAGDGVACCQSDAWHDLRRHFAAPRAGKPETAKEALWKAAAAAARDGETARRKTRTAAFTGRTRKAAAA